MIDNYEYSPTAEDIRIATQEELENLKMLSEKWRSEKKDKSEIDLVEEFKNLLNDNINDDVIAKVLEFLASYECLNEKGEDFRYTFLERYIKS